MKETAEDRLMLQMVKSAFNLGYWEKYAAAKPEPARIRQMHRM
jgi:hypothetical protein